MNKRIYSFFFYILKFCILIFIFFYLKNSFEENNFSLLGILEAIEKNLLIFILSFIFLNIGIILNFLIWQNITIRKKCNINIKDAFYGYFLSELAKYIPGKVLTLASKALFYKLYKKDIQYVTSSIVVEQIASFKSLGLATIVYMLIFYNPFYLYLGENFVLIIIASLIVVFSIFIFNLLKIILLKIDLFKIHVQKVLNLNIKLTFIYSSYYVIANFFFSISFLTIFITFLDTNLSIFEIVKILSSINIGNFLSIVIFFMPAGIGVKEIGTLYFIKDIGSFELVILVLFIFRILNIFSEIILFCFSYFVKKIVKN